jgi:nuclear GTP-binding protein
VINTIKSSKVCRVAPVPGETKVRFQPLFLQTYVLIRLSKSQVWQYITLTRKIYLIDCPGIVPASANDSTTATVLKGVVRVEALATPSEHIPELLKRVKPLYLARTYGLPLPPSGEWEAENLLDSLARMKGRLLKGGEPDMDGVAKVILSDWTRGRIPYFVSPPERSQELNEREERERRIAKARGKDDLKGKAKEEKELRVAKQNLGSIMQKNTFIAEDVKPLEGEADGEDESIEAEEADEEASKGEEEEELAWGDIFGDDAKNIPEASEDEETSGEWGGIHESGMFNLIYSVNLQALHQLFSLSSPRVRRRECRVRD